VENTRRAPSNLLDSWLIGPARHVDGPVAGLFFFCRGDPGFCRFSGLATVTGGIGFWTSMAGWVVGDSGSTRLWFLLSHGSDCKWDSDDSAVRRLQKPGSFWSRPHPNTCVSCLNHSCCVLLCTYDLHQANNDLIKSYCDEIKIIGLSISNDSKVYIAVKYVQIKVSKHAN
jgi:hypothetical protein